MQSEVERLGEALFALSDKLRASGFLNDDANRAAYEKVVAAFQALSSDDRLASLRDVERAGDCGRRQVIELIERLEALPPDELEYVRLLPETQRLLAILSLPSAPGEKG